MIELAVGVMVLALAVAAVGAVIAYAARRSARGFEDSNRVVPETPTNAPAEWAGAHSPEARLHRRLRDAVAALRANTDLDQPALLPVRTELEQQALAVDDRLVAAAALPETHNADSVAQVENAVEAIEAAAASAVDVGGPALESVEQGIEEVRTRLRVVESARAELDALSATPDLEALREKLEGSRESSTRPDDTGTAAEGCGP